MSFFITFIIILFFLIFNRFFLFLGYCCGKQCSLNFLLSPGWVFKVGYISALPVHDY